MVCHLRRCCFLASTASQQPCRHPSPPSPPPPPRPGQRKAKCSKASVNHEVSLSGASAILRAGHWLLCSRARHVWRSAEPTRTTSSTTGRLGVWASTPARRPMHWTSTATFTFQQALVGSGHAKRPCTSLPCSSLVHQVLCCNAPFRVQQALAPTCCRLTAKPTSLRHAHACRSATQRRIGSEAVKGLRRGLCADGCGCCSASNDACGRKGGNRCCNFALVMRQRRG